MTTAERKLATEIANRDLLYAWKEESLVSMGDKGGMLRWRDCFTFNDCARVIHSQQLIEFIVKMLDLGMSFDNTVTVIACAAWSRRRAILDAKKEVQA